MVNPTRARNGRASHKLSLRVKAPNAAAMTKLTIRGDIMVSPIALPRLRIGPNKSGEIHEHPQEQWGVMLEGSGTRIQDGVEHAVQAGDFWQTPGNVPHGFKAGPEGAVVLDIFSPPREEYRRAGSGFR